jgi:hypothetical protein
MKLLVLLDENNRMEKEKAISELANSLKLDLVPNIKLSDVQAAICTSEPKTVLCESHLVSQIDIEKVSPQTRLVLIVNEKLADVASRLPSHVDAKLFLAEDLLGTNELGKLLLKSSLVPATQNARVNYLDLVKNPTAHKTEVVTKASEKNRAVELVETLILESYPTLPPRLVETYAKKAAMICDELILNAIFDANPRLKNAVRNEEVLLEKSEYVTVSIALNENLIALSVVDNFGRFRRESMLHYVSGSNQNDNIAARTSGGMGLRLSIDSSSQMLVQVEASKSTEIISVINLYPSIKEFRQKLKSLLCFFN